MSSRYLNELLRQAVYLRNFRIAYHLPLPAIDKLTALRHAGGIEFKSYSPLLWRRAMFDLFFAPRMTRYDTCFVCGERAQVRHHIIWLKHGGHNWRSNIVFICRKCHAEVHPWLRETL